MLLFTLPEMLEAGRKEQGGFIHPNLEASILESSFVVFHLLFKEVVLVIDVTSKDYYEGEQELRYHVIINIISPVREQGLNLKYLIRVVKYIRMIKYS